MVGAAGCFVKLHPTTEKCVRLDVARVLVEVNLHKPLVERISFIDVDDSKVTVVVSYHWIPQRCTVCKKWGHKGGDCKYGTVTIQKKSPLSMIRVLLPPLQL